MVRPSTPAPQVVVEAFQLLKDRGELRRLRSTELRTRVAAGPDSLGSGQGQDGEVVIDEILDDVPAPSPG